MGGGGAVAKGPAEADPINIIIFAVTNSKSKTLFCNHLQYENPSLCHLGFALFFCPWLFCSVGKRICE
jgi:hypothetical protein